MWTEFFLWARTQRMRHCHRDTQPPYNILAINDVTSSRANFQAI